MLLWGTLIGLWRRWRAYRRTYRELSQLGDRELADINLARGEIEAVAREAARHAA
jgi:uncharacterized protein YjiS (DUF1127 family)